MNAYATNDMKTQKRFSKENKILFGFGRFCHGALILSQLISSLISIFRCTSKKG